MVSPGMSSAMASLNTQLRYRASQRGVYGRDFFGGDLFAQAGSGAVASFFRRGFVNSRGSNCDGRQDGYAFVIYLDEPLANGHKIIVSALAHNQFTRHQLRHDL